MLERGEQRVELGEVGAVLRFELVDFGHAGGEVLLQIQRRQWKYNVHHTSKAKIAIDNAFRQSLRLPIAIRGI